jgi:hypothetical protein
MMKSGCCMKWMAIVLVLTCVADGSHAQKGSDYKPGQKLQRELTLGFDGVLSATKRSFPLPDGEWTVLLGQDVQSVATNDVSNRNPILFGNVFLVQQEAGRATAMLYVSNTVTTRSTTWNDRVCARTDPIHQNKYASTMYAQRCLEVYPLVNFLVNPSAGTQADLKSTLSKMGLSVSPVMVNMFYTQLDQRGHFVRYQYIVDPAQFGLSTADSSLTDSPWHRDRLERDPARQQFAKQFVAYAESLSSLLEGSFSQLATTPKEGASGAAPLARFEWRQ